MKLTTRSYVLKSRAEATEATRERLVGCAVALFAARRFDEITLDDLAAAAGTTVRTALRLFGGKEMLLAAALGAQGTDALGPPTPGDIDASLNSLYDFYEQHGDTVIRWLADEHRVSSLSARLAGGRRNLRRWVAESFAPALDAHPEATRSQLLDALIVALDVYTWKLTRRDFGHSRDAAQAVTRRIVAALVGGN